MLPAVLAVALAAPPPLPVSPQDEAEAQRLARHSALEYDLGHLDVALQDIERAYLLDPRPGLLFNLGQCHRALRHWDLAEKAYRGYLRYRPDAPNRAMVLTLIDEVQRERSEEEQRRRAVRLVPEPPRPPPAPASYPAPLPWPTTPATSRAPVEPPPPITRTAPPAAVEVWPPEPPQAAAKPAEARSGGSAWPWVFAGGALVAAGFSVGGFLQLANYGSLKGQSQTQPVTEAAAQGAEAAYAWGEPLGIVGAALAAACLGGMVWTW